MARFGITKTMQGLIRLALGDAFIVMAAIHEAAVGKDRADLGDVLQIVIRKCGGRLPLPSPSPPAAEGGTE
ncbi:hypothetical protein B2G69_06990 [Methylorubrum zatmanii]|nr:hypothetical protein [Methylorubrum zatmanii]ARO53919.1 hypothetical protein B2G69_06990 [Methylorubrum zatmanii]